MKNPLRKINQNNTIPANRVKPISYIHISKVNKLTVSMDKRKQMQMYKYFQIINYHLRILYYLMQVFFIFIQKNI